MAKLTLNTIGSRYGSIDALNDNFDAIEAAFENTFSRDGTGPNTLEATIDANSQRIINLPDPIGNTEPATKGWIIAQPGQAAASAIAAAASAAAAAVSEANAEESASIIADWEWKEEWATGVVYAVNNIVAIPSGTYEGWSFICVVGHTAGAAFDTDFSAGKWDVLAKRGSTGIGTGDMLAANNLSDLTNISAARTNLGVASATGTGASGNWEISITGIAATATNATNATTAASCSGNAATVTTITTNQVLNATAGGAIGAVGTYAVLYNSSTSDIAINSTVAGSTLGRLTGSTLTNTFANQANQTGSFGTAQTGTWRCLAFCYRRTTVVDEIGTTYTYRPSFFVRIS